MLAAEQLACAGRAYRGPRPRGPAGASRSVTLLEHMPAIGRFVIRLGLAVTYSGALDPSRRDAPQYLRGRPVIPLRFKSAILKKTLTVIFATPNWT